MKPIFAIARASLARNKGQAVSLFIFALFAAFMLNSGLLLSLNFASFFDQKSQETNGPHFSVVESGKRYQPEQLAFLTEYAGVTQAEVQPLLAGQGDIQYNGSKMPAFFLYDTIETQRDIGRFQLTGTSQPLTDDGIYVPNIMNVGGGYRLNDDFTVLYHDREFTFTIKGFTEETFYGALTTQAYRFFITPAAQQHLLDQMPELDARLLSARMTDPADALDLQLAFDKQFFFSGAASSELYFPQYYGAVKDMRTFMSNISSTVLLLFAAILLIICLVDVRFRIANSIEKNMSNNGALKAMGYTNRQLSLAFLLQFVAVTLFGVLAGIGIAYLVLPAVSSILEAQTALHWRQGFDWLSSGLTLALIVGACIIVVLLCTRKIKKLPPLTALRGGLTTHSFKRNHLRLDTSHGRLSWLLALKTVIQNKGQSISVAVIVALVSFAAVAALSVQHNIGSDPEEFLKIIAGELPDCAFMVREPADAPAIYQSIQQDTGVRKTFYYDNRPLMASDIGATAIISDHFELFEGRLLYKGRFPKHDNEVTLSSILSRQLGVGIGDSVSLKCNGDAQTFIVTGLLQTINDSGLAAALTQEGYKRLFADFKPTFLYVYLNADADVDTYINQLSQRFDGAFATTTNLAELASAQMSVYGDIFGAITAVILAITGAVIALVIMLVLKAIILRRKRDYGIQKALGFTSWQLMTQTALNIMPVVVLGVAVGGTIGFFGFNSLFVALMSSMGIMNAALPAPLVLTLVLCTLLCLAAYGLALLFTAQIKKITPYILLSE